MRQYIYTLLLSVFTFQFSTSQEIPLKDDFAHTYSIVAFDEKTGEMAIGVQSNWFAVGKLVPWIKAGVGAVATQSFVNIDYGIEGLERMERGEELTETLKQIINKDDGAAFRQVAMVNTKGEVVAYTGEQCIAEASHYIGKHFSVQANMMANKNVVPIMAETYERNTHLPLAERIVLTLQAAEKAGGDLRGKQSAALVLADSRIDDKRSKNVKKIDLRVDDAKNPLVELERLLTIHRAYEFMNEADVALENRDYKRALNLYNEAERLQPNNIEIQFWKALAMMQTADKKKGEQQMKKIISRHSNWQHLLYRLVEANAISLTREDLDVLER